MSDECVIVYIGICFEGERGPSDRLKHSLNIKICACLWVAKSMG